MPDFTEEQLIAISEVLEVTRDTLNSQIVFLGSRVTSAVVNRIDFHITTWDDQGLGSDHIKVHPNVANFGAEIDPEKEKNRIRKSIANLLELESWGASASYYTVLERG